MDIETARSRLGAIRAQRYQVRPEELDEIWRALDTVRPEQILGAWKGSEIDNGHPLCGKLETAGWYGKTFDSLLDAKPLVMRGKDGELYSNTELGRGEASLWMVEFRGESTATMVYDGRPIFDHLKKIDDHTLLGMMNGKSHGDAIFQFDDGAPLFTFVLDRDPA